MYTVQRLRKIMPSTWVGVEIEKVDRIPEGGIDGLKIYELNTTAPTSNHKQELLKDGREWKKDCVRVNHFGTHTCALVPPSERQKEKVERT